MSTVPRLITRTPTYAQPKLPTALAQQMETVGETFDIRVNHIARIILRETLADASLHDAIVEEIQRQADHPLYGDSTDLVVGMNDETSKVFAGLMASTGARATRVARAVLIVGCSGGLSRFRKHFIAAIAHREAVTERQRAKVIELAARLGMVCMVRA